MQLQLHYHHNYNSTTTTTTAALHHTTSSSCGWGDRPGDHCNHCSHSKKHSSNHLSVHQWICSAIRDSQQPISPIGFLFLKLPPPPSALLLVLFMKLDCRRKFRSQTSDHMTRWKSRGGKSQRQEEKKKEDQRGERVRGKKMQVREKVEKSRFTVFLQWFVAPDGRSKSRLAKAAGAEPSGQMGDEKMHAVEARSTFPSQNAQSTPGSVYFWKLRCRKSARLCGAQDMSKSKVSKTDGSEEVEMLKQCTPLWREASFKIKMHKTPQCRTTFGSWDVEKVHAVVAQSTFRSQHVQITACSCHFWTSKRRFMWQAPGILHPCRKWAKREGFVAFPKTMAGVGHLQRIWKDGFRVAGAVQETCSSGIPERLHFGASDL